MEVKSEGMMVSEGVRLPLMPLNVNGTDAVGVMNHQESYGVFCMAMSMPNRNERELDVLWADAIRMYQSFLVSEYNDPNESELECIHKYVNANS